MIWRDQGRKRRYAGNLELALGEEEGEEAEMEDSDKELARDMFE